MKVLIVDDDITTLKRLECDVHWKSLGVTQTYIASSASMARGLIETKPIDLILLDIEMPVEKGLSLLKWLRASQWKAISCILLTAHAQFEFAQEAISLAVDAYLLKPLDIPAIEATVAKVLHRCGKSDLYDDIAPEPDTLPLVEQMKFYLNDHYAQKITAIELSQRFHYNPDYLSQIFKKHESVTPVEYLAHVRIERARVFLTYDSSLSISEIATLVGFGSASYFSTQFKHLVGVTPMEYRQRKGSGGR